MKCFHGLDRAKGFGLGSVTVQAKLTAIAVNLKKIAAAVGAIETEPIMDELGIPAPEGQKAGGMQMVDAPVPVNYTLYFAFFPEFALTFALAQKFVAALQ